MIKTSKPKAKKAVSAQSQAEPVRVLVKTQAQHAVSSKKAEPAKKLATAKKVAPLKQAKPATKSKTMQAKPASKAKAVQKLATAKKAAPLKQAKPARKAKSAQAKPESKAKAAKNTTNKSHQDGMHVFREHQENFTKAAKEAFVKAAKHVNGSKVNHKAIIEHHKKNLEVLNQASKKATEVMKSIANLQSQFVKQTFEDLNAMVRGAMSQKPDKNPDFSEPVEMMKNSFQRAVSHAKNEGSMISNSHKEIHARMHERMEEGKEEIKDHLTKSHNKYHH